ncbi:hypothetical protein FSP39_016950, partial [Pinctada imbricata]
SHKPIYVGKKSYDEPKDDISNIDGAYASDLDTLDNDLRYLIQHSDAFQRDTRYKPRIVGRSDENPMDGEWMEKRRSPLFVGKRRAPIFVGKRRMHLIVGRGLDRAPKFVGRRRSPLFVGRRSNGRNYRDPVFSYVVMRRSVSSSGNAAPFSQASSAQSLLLALDDQSLADKSRQGRYIHPTAQAQGHVAQFALPQHKRFVSPTFIGKRTDEPNNLDSYDPDNSGFDIDHQPMVVHKRFEVPMFIGKRYSDTIENRENWNAEHSGAINWYSS